MTSAPTAKQTPGTAQLAEGFRADFDSAATGLSVKASGEAALAGSELLAVPGSGDDFEIAVAAVVVYTEIDSRHGSWGCFADRWRI